MIKKIAILGAGNGGCTFAGHLAIKGFDVALYEDPKFENNLKGIIERGGIELTGSIQGFGQLSTITTNIEEALRGADVIMLVVPAFAQLIMIEKAIPFLEDGQIVVFNPDNFASIAFKGMLVKKGIIKDIKIAGAESLLYATRRSGDSTVDVWGIKDVLSIGVIPASDTEKVLSSLKEMFSEFVPASDTLTISLANVNMIIHCPAVLLNTGRIEDTNGDFEFYWGGMTKSVCKVMEAMDQERIRVAKAIGVELGTSLDCLKRLYPNEQGESLHDFLTHSKVHGGRGSNAPNSLSHRYLVEDVANGLIPLSILGDLVNVPTPTVDSIIHLSEVINSVDYFQTGRNLEVLGLSGMSPEEIMKYVKE